jgi:hypothetical protein
MPKYRPAGSKKSTPSSNRGLIPCAIVVFGGLILIFVLFYLVLQSGN